MLTKLHIQNYAIIDELEIDFDAQLNIITGETGAGKSILMGALSLILGERAESGVALNKNNKCVVEGFFKSTQPELVLEFLTKNDLDNNENELVLRREIAANGKSRAFINDTPVNLSQLKTISNLLVDLHQQFDTIEIGSSNFQQQVLDALAENTELLQKYIVQFNLYNMAKNELILLQEKQLQANTTLDYNQYLLNELDEIKLQENELENIEDELKILTHAEKIKDQLGKIYADLKLSEQPILPQLKILSNNLISLKNYHSSFESLATRLQSCYIELQDIANEVEQIDNGIVFNEQRIQIVNDRMASGYKLLKKHNVATTKDLLDIQIRLQETISSVINISDTIDFKKNELQAIFKKAEKYAIELSNNRKKIILPFIKNVNEGLLKVGMPNAKFNVELLPTEQLQELGKDKIEFLFDANKTGNFELLRKVASGGELSRLMLIVKSLVAKKLQLPTLIFDEIDTGISGEAAKQVSYIMKNLSISHQIIAITHQPQIAAKADAHYFVYKNTDNEKVTTSVKKLKLEDRVSAIAKMLSGENLTPASLQIAKEMMEN